MPMRLTFFLACVLLIVVAVLYRITTWFSCPEPSLSEQEQSKHLPTTDRPVVDVVVTLTTLPHRVETVLKSTLHSLRIQSALPRSVEINVPHTYKDGSRYDLPPWLQAEHTAGRVTIFRVDDVGPATKYIPTLQRYQTQPQQRILVIDDDMLLHPKRVEEFYAASQRFPDDVLAAYGLMIDKGAINWLNCVLPFDDLKTALVPGTTRTQEEPIDIITGFQNYLIQPRFFDLDALTNYDSMPPEAFYVDDIVISGHLARRGVIRRVPREITGLNHLTTKHFGDHVKAILQNKRDDRNLTTGPNAGDRTNNVMIQFFKEDW